MLNSSTLNRVESFATADGEDVHGAAVAYAATLTMAPATPSRGQRKRSATKAAPAATNIDGNKNCAAKSNVQCSDAPATPMSTPKVAASAPKMPRRTASVKIRVIDELPRGEAWG